MADGYCDKVKFTGSRTGNGVISNPVRIAPYRLVTDVKNVTDIVFLETKAADDDSIWEHAWYTVEAGSQLSIYQVVDTYERAGEYTATPPSAVDEFAGFVEVGAIANSQTLPVIGPDGAFLNGAAVNSSLIQPDIAAIQAKNDVVDGQKFFAADSRHIPSGGGFAGGGTGLMVKYDAASGVASDYSNSFPMTSGLGGRLLLIPLKIPITTAANTIAAGNVLQILNANRDGAVWRVQAWSDANRDSFCEATIIGDATTPEIRGAIEIGNLTLSVSGTSIRIQNTSGVSADFSYSIEERR